MLDMLHLGCAEECTSLSSTNCLHSSSRTKQPESSLLIWIPSLMKMLVVMLCGEWEGNGGEGSATRGDASLKGPFIRHVTSSCEHLIRDHQEAGVDPTVRDHPGNPLLGNPSVEQPRKSVISNRPTQFFWSVGAVQRYASL